MSYRLHVILTVGRGEDGGGNTCHARRWRANCNPRPAVAVCCRQQWAVIAV